jgi:hypothetical protein
MNKYKRIKKVFYLVIVSFCFHIGCKEENNRNTNFFSLKSSIDSIISFQKTNFTYDSIPVFDFQLKIDGFGDFNTYNDYKTFYKDSIIFINRCYKYLDTFINFKSSVRISSDSTSFHNLSYISQIFWSSKHNDSLYRVIFENKVGGESNVLIVGLKSGITGIYILENYAFSHYNSVIKNIYGDIFLDKIDTSNIAIIRRK